MQFSDNITEVKGIGEKTAALFKKLGITTVSELIMTYPRRYLTYDSVVPLAECEEGERVSVMAIIVSYVEVKKFKSISLTTLTARDESGSMRVVFYNSPFLKNVFHKGQSFVFVGSVKKKNGMRTMEMPEYYTESDYERMTSVMQPVYPLTAGLSNKIFQKAVRSVAPLIMETEDYLPSFVKEEFSLKDRAKSLYDMHFPENQDELKESVKRIAFDEFYAFLYEVKLLRDINSREVNTHRISSEVRYKLNEFITMLPFKLTNGQSQAVNDIYNDLSSGQVMNRLIQGDVGSGKTIVGAAALYMMVISGYQGALMVPTEVLANQHYEDLSGLFKSYNIRVELLTGHTPAKEKRHIYDRLKNKEIDIIIGTHALIQDKVEFANLGLVITDEQHRFGVRQREKLEEKGERPHVLIMSATPIPRTLAIIMYADLDISVIKDMPEGRKPIKNCVVGTSYRKTAMGFISSQIKDGHQAYIICPMVEENEALDVENVTEYKERLISAFPENIRIEMLHGKMKDDEKTDILMRFRNREIDILVSTTVVEVGINNPNATVMMIENAERFGLAQLHQLRGRVGRGDAQSYCIFINSKKTEESMERLRVLEESNDGFFIASSDLKLRGPGDFFGVRQSGEMEFEIADIYNHADMLKLAQEAVLKYSDTVKPAKLSKGFGTL